MQIPFFFERDIFFPTILFFGQAQFWGFCFQTKLCRDPLHNLCHIHNTWPPWPRLDGYPCYPKVTSSRGAHGAHPEVPTHNEEAKEVPDAAGIQVAYSAAYSVAIIHG